MRDRDPVTPSELLRGAQFMSLFWAVGTTASAVRGDTNAALVYLVLVNLWVVAMWLGRYLARTQR